ncbi:hypothetical protein ACFFUB_04835 [Algimonas porphyrae]|uniref:Tetratricopeptide repeat protein n=1 Tax=Algimonas porphyrae TaxID=1128113 RepID=A0ABQ5UYB0_9PROT|nr:hypothetical protein [Algimonas porphyrae]GLQ19899.1 hypothetical protein GCM10007854_08540 [Algimonas porphyrae]
MMNALKFRTASLLGASLMAVATVSLSGVIAPAFAQEPAPEEARQFSAAAGEKVNEALQAINADDPQTAINILNGLLSTNSELIPYERSIIYQMLGQSYNDVNNMSMSLQSFQSAIDSGGLLPAEAEQIELAIAQLLIANEQYREGALKLEALLARGVQEKPSYVDLLVSAWVSAEEYQRALPWAERWFNRANPKEKKHFDLLNFLYNDLGMPERQADIVKEMIQRWPEDQTNWNNWISLLASGGREKDAFEVNKMLYLGGALTSEPDIKKVISYYSYYDMPYQAAVIMDREMNAGRVSRSADNLKELSNYWRAAREYGRAIPVLEEAAKSSSSAKLYADLGEAFFNEGQCDKAETAFRQAIDRGYDAGKSWMQVANCIYDSTQKASRLDCEMTDAQMDSAPITQIRAKAIQTFQKVPSTSREARNARRWIKFITEERQAVEARCEFERNVERELCYSKIKLEYDNIVFAGGEFDLEDENCLKFKPDYDRLYVRTTTG